MEDDPMEKVLFTGLTGRSDKYPGDLLVQNGHTEAIALVRSAE